jgi:hypothetical protein
LLKYLHKLSVEGKKIKNCKARGSKNNSQFNGLLPKIGLKAAQ